MVYRNNWVYMSMHVLDEDETSKAFSCHFEKQLSLFKHVTCLNLVDRGGRENIVAEAFLHHVLLYNHPQLVYVAFDFHEYWLVFIVVSYHLT